MRVRKACWRRRLLARLLVAAVGCAVAGTGLSAQRATVVGVLEYPQCRDSSERVVRALFEASASGWHALPVSHSRDLPTTWTIAFDGRARGELTVVDTLAVPVDEWSRRDRLLAVRAPGQQLRITARSADFFGWCAAPAARPLVVVSSPNASDPDGWRQTSVSAAQLEAVLPAFRDVARSTVICPKGVNVAEPFAFGLSHLEAVRGYEDRTGRQIVGVRLRNSLYNCDGLLSDGWVVHWFDLSSGPRLLGRELTLVDAGDYDGDGRSELLFWYSGYNRDGYVLFSADLKRLAEYQWSYH